MTSTPILLVTGGSRGIGAATARLAGMRGYDVAVNYKGDKAAAEGVVSEITKTGRRAVAIQADIANEADVERLFADVDAFGPLTHLVHNSGITGKNSRFDMVDTQTLRDVIDVNVMGSFLVARQAIRRISTRHGGAGGAIVFLSSAVATLGAPGEYVWYAASKGAVDSLTIGLSRELALENIRVNAVAPGAIETDIHEPGRIARISSQLPMGRAGTPDEVAETILYLLSDAASYVSGTIVRVSGAR